MTAPEPRTERTIRQAARRDGPDAGPITLDGGETRPILWAGGALLLFLYLIRSILLPFILAAIVA